MFAAEEDAVGGMGAAHVEQARGVAWHADAVDDFAAQHHRQRCQPGVVARQGLACLWLGGVFFVGHADGLLVGAYYLRHMFPDGYDVGAMQNVGGDAGG